MTFSPIGYCGDCYGPMTASCRKCNPEPLAVLGSLYGMRVLAQSLLAHYEIDPDEYPEVVNELETEVGEELLDLGREALARHGISIPAEIGAQPMSITGSNSAASACDGCGHLADEHGSGGCDAPLEMSHSSRQCPCRLTSRQVATVTGSKPSGGEPG